MNLRNIPLAFEAFWQTLWDGENADYLRTGRQNKLLAARQQFMDQDAEAREDNWRNLLAYVREIACRLEDFLPRDDANTVLHGYNPSPEERFQIALWLGRPDPRNVIPAGTPMKWDGDQPVPMRPNPFIENADTGTPSADHTQGMDLPAIDLGHYPDHPGYTQIGHVSGWLDTTQQGEEHAP